MNIRNMFGNLLNTNYILIRFGTFKTLLQAQFEEE
jgi:hypothetical protein